MSKYGFLDILEEEMDKAPSFDFEINSSEEEPCGRSGFSPRSANTEGLL